MIELIFAIVVMGIVMLSVPMVLSQSSKSIYTGLQQEAIAAISAQMAIITTYHWDENDTNLSLGSPILETNSTNAGLQENGSTGRRVGMPQNSARTYRINTGGRLSASAIGLNSDENSSIETFDDIDDFNGGSIALTSESTSTENGDYIDKNITITTSIGYGEDNVDFNASSITFNALSPSATGTTNIKNITLVLTTNNTEVELEKNITMRAFSCNIGSYKLNTRLY